MTQPPPSHDPRFPPTQPAPPSGALAWGLGLLVFLLVPFFSTVIAGVTMLAVGAHSRTKGGLAHVNARNAANWGGTYLVLTLILVPLHFVLLLTLADGPYGHDFFPLGTAISLWGLVTLFHIVVSILGLIFSLTGKVFWIPAIPFLRAGRP
ncbi:hypothetical protein Bra3105_05615 [Brachybacterium halotolerans subsp. kimchii]|uniref:hypothetical protein n=1 Tax=Brachybacterium halotolerans TaxID=2795215 RepID=UPI001E4FA23D|nr:hypothetical protein [Brachybacterium halotolerans]UEJ83792.1 hypothetical protein Bra3105_05615 [Brachybacterium halotolerans subsp. kimchii]